MVFVSIHRIKKVIIDKYWLDSGTFVVKMDFRNLKNELTEITLFSNHSEPFESIVQNKPIENLDSKSE